MFPLVIVGIAVVGFMIGNSKKSLLSTGNARDSTPTRAGGHFPPTAPRQLRAAPCPIDILRATIRQGRRPGERLVAAAVSVAYKQGDYVLADAIITAFEKQLAPSEAPASPPTVDPDAPASEPVASVPPTPEPRSYPSPIEGVDDDEWSTFANSMKIHPPEFETDRHVGAFHQRKDRLKQLQLQVGKDEEEQYQAFVRDCLDHLGQKKMIGEYVTSVVKVSGEDHVVTASGLLGLMKAAGAKNAAHWIENEAEREKFPKTTEIFLRCNNCF